MSYREELIKDRPGRYMLIEHAFDIAARADARIAELEQAVTVRDTEIARLETDLELARIELSTHVATIAALKTDAVRYAVSLTKSQGSIDWRKWMLVPATDAQFIPNDSDYRALQLDAERYRWLKSHAWIERGDTDAIMFGAGCHQTNPTHIDDAVDAARAGNGGGV